MYGWMVSSTTILITSAEDERAVKQNARTATRVVKIRRYISITSRPQLRFTGSRGRNITFERNSRSIRRLQGQGAVHVLLSRSGIMVSKFQARQHQVSFNRGLQAQRNPGLVARAIVVLVRLQHPGQPGMGFSVGRIKN